MIEFVMVAILFWCGIRIGRLLESDKIYRCLIAFYDKEQAKAHRYTPDFIRGMFYVGDYLTGRLRGHDEQQQKDGE